MDRYNPFKYKKESFKKKIICNNNKNSKKQKQK